LKDELWLKSGPCKLLGFLNNISIEMSFMIYNILNIIYVYVLGSKKQKHDNIFAKVFGAFCVALIFVISFGLAQVFTTGSLQLGLCLYSNEILASWYFNIGFALMNMLMHISSITLCLKLLAILHSHTKALEELGHTGRTPIRANAKKIFIISMLTNLACRIPFEVFLWLSVAKIEVDPLIVAWMAIVVFPMTSIANPYVHTLRPMILDFKHRNVPAPTLTK